MRKIIQKQKTRSLNKQLINVAARIWDPSFILNLHDCLLMSKQILKSKSCSSNMKNIQHILNDMGMYSFNFCFNKYRKNLLIKCKQGTFKFKLLWISKTFGFRNFFFFKNKKEGRNVQHECICLKRKDISL